MPPRTAQRISQTAQPIHVATISHELRTPMNAVLGYPELLADEIDGSISALQKDHPARQLARLLGGT